MSADKEKSAPKQERARKKRKNGRPTATDLIEEGMHLLRKTPLSAWTVYMGGAATFIFGFLFFCEADRAGEGKNGKK